MQRPLLIGALVAIALTGIGGGIWVLTRPNEPQVDTAPADEGQGPRRARRGSRHGEASDPMRDANDDSPVTPPDVLIAIIRPHDPKLAQPDATPVPLPSTLPNVVVMLGCTVRKDQMSPYGADSFITPRLDALAKSGTLFDDVIAAAPWTRAAST